VKRERVERCRHKGGGSKKGGDEGTERGSVHNEKQGTQIHRTAPLGLLQEMVYISVSSYGALGHV